MHEMSLVQGLMDIIDSEMAKHGVTRLLKIRVKYGTLAAVVPDAMAFAWECLTKETPWDGAELELVEVPITLKCCDCGTEFSPEGTDILCVPCPNCGEDLGHMVLTGKELYLDHLEAE